MLVSRDSGELCLNQRANLARAADLPFVVLGFAVAYFLAARVGIATSLPPEGIVIIWPPNAIILVVLLTVAPKRWWLFGLATVATEVFADLPSYPLWSAVGFGAVNFAEAGLAAFLLSRMEMSSPAGSSVQELVRFIAVGPVLASGAAALLGAGIYKIGSPDVDYLHYWRIFWFGDALGLLIVGTSLLVFRTLPAWWGRPPLRTGLEALLLAACLATSLTWAFLAQSRVPNVYLISPFLLWAAVRFGSHGACAAVLAAVGMAIASAAGRVGPFAGLSSVDVVMALQGLAVIIAVSTYFVAFTVEDFWRADARLRAEVGGHADTAAQLQAANARLEQSKQELDDLVAQRTSDLQRTLARNELLLTEVHHRVKNSLQMVASIVTLQGRSGTARELSEKINDQISAIAATYDVIQRMGVVETVDLSFLVKELGARLSRSAGEAASLSCNTAGEARVSADAAIAAALAINELVTNSIKHSADGARAVIRLACRREDGEVVLSVADNGPGFPIGFDFTGAMGFGLRMTQAVITRAGGELRLIGRDGGSTVEVRLPAVDS